MTEKDWTNGIVKALAVRLSGEAGLTHLTERGEQELDDTFLMLVNASPKEVAFRLAEPPEGACWEIVLDTHENGGKGTPASPKGGEKNAVQPNSLRLMIAKQQADT